MNRITNNNRLGKKVVRMIIIAGIILSLLLAVTPLGFFASVNKEWKTRSDIKSVSKNLSLVDASDMLNKIASNDRILEIVVASKDGSVLYTLKGMSLFSDPAAKVFYDSETGLIKFEGGRISYFQRNSILGSLLNVGDNDLDFDDDDDDREKIPSFDYRFVKDNIYQTIVLDDNLGNSVYIVCTQSNHAGFILFLVLAIMLWSIFLAYAFAVIAYIIYKQTIKICPKCQSAVKRGNKHCTKCGASILPPRCSNCNAVVGLEDKNCGKCGQLLEDK